MDDTANPATPTPAKPEANGYAPDPRPALTGMQMRPLKPDPKTGEIVLECGPDAAAYFDDLGWFEEESWAGRWFPYSGKYVAILNKTHVGTDDDSVALRERVARDYGVDPERVLIQYIPSNSLIEG